MPQTNTMSSGSYQTLQPPEVKGSKFDNIPNILNIRQNDSIDLNLKINKNKIITPDSIEYNNQSSVKRTLKNHLM